MKSLSLLITFFLISALGTIIIYKLNFHTNNDQVRNINNIHQDAPSRNIPLDEQIENWSLYEEDNSIHLGTGHCGNKKFETFLDTVNGGDRHVLLLNGEYELVITPNYEGWTNDEFTAWNSDTTAFCAAGAIYPAKAYLDKLLWKGGCSTGAIPSEDAPSYNSYIKCVEAEKIVESFLQVNE